MQCPKCGGEMWDNRQKKADGTFKANAPDYKCKLDSCAEVVWPDKDEQGAGPPPMREQPPVEDEQDAPAEHFTVSKFKHCIVDATMLAEWAKKHGLNVSDVEIAKWATTLFINRG